MSPCVTALCLRFISMSPCRNVTLEKEIFPAATDSRFIRAVSICKDIKEAISPWRDATSSCALPAQRQVRGLFPGSALGGHPCHWIFPHEPDTDPAARSQRVPERASLSERHRRVRAAHPGSRQRPCLSRRGLDNSLIFNPLRKTLRGWSEYWTWIICRDYQRKMPYLA